AARPSAIRRTRASSDSLPREKTARSRLATTYTLYRGPQSWTSEGASQLDALALPTRAWIERSAARGILSCRPAHAARARELTRLGSRSSRAPTRRRNVRICGRVRIRRELVMSVLAESARGHARWAHSAM